MCLPGMPCMNERILIVTPVLDDWPSFGMLVQRISDAFAGTDRSFHVLAVDDGSSVPFESGSMRLPENSCIAEISILRLAMNLGHQRAIAVGLSRIAKREDIDAVVVMDSDGEDRPEDIAALCVASHSHPGQVVLARRVARSETRVFRLVPRVVHIAGYSLFSLTRASAAVNCQSALVWFLLRLRSHAATSSLKVCLSGIRRSRH